MRQWVGDMTAALVMLGLVGLVWGCDITTDSGDDHHDGAATIYTECVEGCTYRLSLEVVGDIDPSLVTWYVAGLEVGNGTPMLYEFPGAGYYRIRATWFDAGEWLETTTGRDIDCEEDEGDGG